MLSEIPFVLKRAVTNMAGYCLAWGMDIFYVLLQIELITKRSITVSTRTRLHARPAASCRGPPVQSMNVI